MKKFLPFLVAIMWMAFLISSPILARSGCCSHHGGVCCECGAQSNGKVICNDGWRGSSCYYSEMVKCVGHAAPAPVMKYLHLLHNLALVQNNHQTLNLFQFQN